MSIPKPPDPAKLVISVFMRDKAFLGKVFDPLEQIGGRADMISNWLAFDFTDYYHKEMGSPLYRKVIAFKDLIDQQDLARIKTLTNQVEEKNLVKGKRQVNIDPGYLLPSRFILATGKDYSHRIYIGERVYADLTLIYTKQGFRPLEWTYPDYSSSELTDFLEKIRNKYVLDLKERQNK